MTESNEVKLHFLDYWRVIKVRAGLITLVFLLVMVTAGVTVYFLPREYLAKVTMEVKPDNYKQVDIFAGSRGSTYDPQFVATQFQILRKAEILIPVIKQIELVKEFSGDGPPMTEQQVLREVITRLNLQDIRNTAMIEIGFYHTDRQLAANVANTIADVYRDKRMQDLQEALDRNLAQFQDEVAKQRKVVEQAYMEAAQIRERLGIVDDLDNTNAPVSDRGTIASDTAVNEQRTKVAEIRTQLERVESLTADKLLEVLRMLNITDQTVEKTLPQLQEATAEEAKYLNSGLGENHPRIRSLRAQRQVYVKTLGDALEGIRSALATKLKVAEDTLQALEQRYEVAKAETIKTKTAGGEYIDAKSKYQNAKRILESAEMQLSTERMKQKIEGVPVKIWERAEPPIYPAKPPVMTYLILAALIGLVVGVGLAFFIEYLDTSVKTLDDVERFLQIPVLAVVPKGVPILMRTRTEHPDAEAYRILRANIEFNKPSPDSKTITLISGGPGEGKSTTLNNLAYTCAKGGYNVLVVDADLRRPSQHNFFDGDNSFGLTDYLTGKATIDAITKTTKIDNLSFVPSGHLPPDNVGLLNSQRMADLIQRVKGQYDLVFFDSPPILGVSDGSVLASEMDMTIMVIQHRRFPRAMLQRVKQAVHQVGGALIGVVLNNVDTRHDEGYSYYNAYNEYYSAPRRGGAPKAAAAPAAGGAATAPRRQPVAAAPRTDGNAGEY
jgi:polysaccharide biosynthesis transport protein